MNTPSVAVAGPGNGQAGDPPTGGENVVVNSTSSLETFYAATYPRVVAMLVLLVGSRHEAEEIAQEAFIKLLPRWERVRTYEDPEAWVRTTARHLATSRWRRAVVAAKALPLLRPGSEGRRLGRCADDVDLDVDLAATLQKLSYAHREVLVLHHAMELGVDEIANEIGVSPGTVKSRLHRARAAARSASEGATSPSAIRTGDHEPRGEIR